MNEANTNNEKNEKFTENRLEKEPQTGLTVVVGGPPITKEKVKRDFPVDCCRDATILRRSVGLGKKDPFEKDQKSNKDYTSKEQVAKDFPRDCCRFAKFIRRSVGLTENDDSGASTKCCFAE
jgi:hypothetical protein